MFRGYHENSGWRVRFPGSFWRTCDLYPFVCSFSRSLSLALSPSMSVCLSVCPSVRPFVSFSVSLALSLYVSLHMSVDLSPCVSNRTRIVHILPSYTTHTSNHYVLQIHTYTYMYMRSHMRTYM